ncbi:MAG: hypothetical protein ACJAZO_004271 [Myxococcota bacterium]|jgi:hypothetical protein
MAPQYTVRDLPWYAGAMLGTAGIYSGLLYSGLMPSYWPRLLISGACGIGLGYLFTVIYDRSVSK